MSAFYCDAFNIRLVHYKLFYINLQYCFQFTNLCIINAEVINFLPRIIFIKKLRKSKLTKVKTEKIAVKSMAPVLDKNKLCRGVNRWNKNCKAQNIVDNPKNKNNILYLLALLPHQNMVLCLGIIV